jgi:hypothetical protein
MRSSRRFPDRPLKVRIVNESPRNILINSIRIVREYWLPAIQAPLTIASIVLAFLSFDLAKTGYSDAEKNRIASAKFINTVDSHLTMLNRSFAGLNISVSRLPLTVEKMDSSIFEMQIEINKMEDAVYAFQATLSNLSAVSDSQLSLIRETQKQWAEELLKKPKIDIVLYSVYRDSADNLTIIPQFINRGTKYAKDIVSIIRFNKNVELSSKGWAAYLYERVPRSWSYLYSGSIGSGQLGYEPPMEYSLHIPEINKIKNIILYFKNSHTFVQPIDSLIIPIPKPDSIIYLYKFDD